jgi:hypothetical protein
MSWPAFTLLIGIVCATGCGAAPVSATGCEAYVQAIEGCLDDLGVAAGQRLEQQIACNGQHPVDGADAYYQCMSDAIEDGSCALDGREDPLLFLARQAARCHPRHLDQEQE